MKKQFLILFVLFLGVNMIMANTPQIQHNLMPVPLNMKFTEGKFYISDSFKVKLSGNPAERINGAISRMVARLAGRTGFFLEQSFFNPNADITNPDLTVSVSQPAEVVFGEDESYSLNISDAGIALQANTDLGAMHGLETIMQLLSADQSGYFFPYVEITDKPRFPWRGLMIDACRHFMPVEVIKRNLDGMAAVKLNVLHWHLSEDQGFRVECKIHPKLHELGSDGFYFTQAQVKDVIAYANERGIRVMPEFDLPGHATSWLTAYPELASAPGPFKIERNWGVFDPTFNPTSETTYEFLDAFFEEMSELFPDAYMHIGGDENNGKQWSANADIQQFMKENELKDNHALQSYFNQRLLKILTKYNKKLMGWDEILQPGLPKDIVIQSWRGKKAMIQAAQEGYQTLLSNGYYIDLVQPTDFHYLNDPAPADLPLTVEQKKMILGGEATMWAELVSPETVDSRIWPRTAAIAERFWSAEEVKDVPDMYRRLKTISFQIEELGLTHNKNYPMLLRRLTGNQDISALKTLVDVIEPVKKYKRHRLRKQYSYTPLTRVVDAARPDAEVARTFSLDVSRFLENPSKQAKLFNVLKQQLEEWVENHDALLEISKNSPVLKEIEPMSESLKLTAEVGIEGLDKIHRGNSVKQDWIKQKLLILNQAKEPKAQCELMLVDAVVQIIEYLDPEAK